MSGCPQIAAALLHGMDSTGADQRPDVEGEGGLCAGGEGHQPHILPSDGDARKTQLQLVQDSCGWGAVPEDVAPPEVGAVAPALWVRPGWRGVRDMSTRAAAVGADVVASRPRHSIDREAPPRLLIHGWPRKAPELLHGGPKCR